MCLMRNQLKEICSSTSCFRDQVDKLLAEETLALIKELTTVKDGKRFGDKMESLIFIYK